MYPQQELNDLARAREHLQARIAQRRAHCVAAVGVLAAPIDLVDRALVLWRKFSPLLKIAAVPLLVFLRRRYDRQDGVMGAVLRWAPTVLESLRRVA